MIILLTKKELRKIYLDKRNKMSNEDLITKSKIISDNLLEDENFKKSNVFMIYIDFNKEVITTSIINYLLNDNKDVLVPYVKNKEKSELGIRKIKSIDNDCKIGTYGIIEPDLNTTIEVNQKDIECIVIPGVVFDTNLNRLGFGKGYYDRLLSKLNSKVIKIGIAFDFQIIDKVPVDKYDIKLDIIYTESKKIK